MRQDTLTKPRQKSIKHLKKQYEKSQTYFQEHLPLLPKIIILFYNAPFLKKKYHLFVTTKLTNQMLIFKHSKNNQENNVGVKCLCIAV